MTDEVVKIDFRDGARGPKGLYKGRHLEVRKYLKQTRFYEVTESGKEYCLKKDTIKWLLHIGSLPRLKLLREIVN